MNLVEKNIVKKDIKLKTLIAVLVLYSVSPLPAMAAIVIPPSADPSRMMMRNNGQVAPMHNIGSSISSVNIPDQALPEDADKITFELKEVKVSGSSVYKDEKLAEIWANDIGKKITLKRIYEINAEITAKYRYDGYFLTRAYVPAQSIENGVVKIDIAEGSVSEIDYGKNWPNNMGPINAICARVTKEKPIRINTIERMMLLLNDISKEKYHANLLPLDSNKFGERFSVKMVISKDTEKPNKQGKLFDTHVDVDNSGSKYVGTTIATVKIKPLVGVPDFQNTEFTFSGGTTIEEMQMASVQHDIPINYDGLILSLSAGYNHGKPGHLLKASDVNSKSLTGDVTLKWDAIRARTNNLKFSLGLNAVGNTIKALSTKISRDSLRILKVGMHWDNQDAYSGITQVDTEVRKGLNIWNASSRSDADISRENGNPEALSYTMSLNRFQHIYGDYNMQFGVSGQFSDSKLLSLQQFGYGGSVYGRAYDNSEITGDSGVSSMIELQHNYTSDDGRYHFQHFAFYDIGKVWGVESSTDPWRTAASAGIGIRFSDDKTGLNTMVGLAQPLTKKTNTPTNGNSESVRLLFSASMDF